MQFLGLPNANTQRRLCGPVPVIRASLTSSWRRSDSGALNRSTDPELRFCLRRQADVRDVCSYVGFSNRPFRVKRFRLSTTTVLISLAGSCFSSESAPGPSIMGFEDEVEHLQAALPADWRQVRADIRSHLIHRPARDIIPPLGGARSFLLLNLIPARCSCCCRDLFLGSSGTQYRQSRCGA